MPVQHHEGYRFLDHVTDAFVEAWGDTLETALAQAGLAFFDIITDTTKIRPAVPQDIIASGHDELELVYNWLEALLLKFEINHLIFCQFHVGTVARRNTGFQVKSRAKGEVFDSNRHSRRVEVKGITYHLMAIERESGRTTLRFILDL